MRLENPYHEGELLVQERSGEVELGHRNGRVIGDTILAGAFGFISCQSVAAVGSLDKRGNVWASLLLGQPGFLTPDGDRALMLDLTKIARHPRDPLWTHLEHRREVGMLLIDLASRRRLRINGRLAEEGPDALRLEVAESYPNCPKYIQRRRLVSGLGDGPDRPGATRHGVELGADQQSFVASADTLFVASAHPERGVDASHRGGRSGFVQILDERTLRVPDYAGNSMFNTLGNIAVQPRAGLIVPDFDGGRTLQMIGRAEIRWDLDDPDNATGGTRRFWDFEVEGWLESELSRPVRWEFLDASPFNPA